MHDSDYLENEAEYRVASELLRFGIIVAKPLIDKLGGDLLALLSVSDGARFIRIQSKGRSLENSKSCQIEIPKEYVSESFVCFLYLRTPTLSEIKLSIFFSDEIGTWNQNKKNELSFSVSVGSYMEKLQAYEFDEVKANRLKEIIREADVEKQYELLILQAIHDEDHSFKIQSRDRKLIYSDKNSEVYVKKSFGGLWDTTEVKKSTGVEITRSACPGHPDDFEYNPITDTWVAK